MILGFHITLSCYGHWLPNDPRGSGSRFVWGQKLYKVGGKATKTESRQSVAHAEHDVCLRLAAKEKLKFPPVQFSEPEIVIVGAAFGMLLREKSIVTFACVVVPDHAHLLVGPMETSVDEIVIQLKETAVVALLDKDEHPRARLAGYDEPLEAAASLWSVGCWKVYIDNRDRMLATIAYIERHRASQRWDFVVPYK